MLDMEEMSGSDLAAATSFARSVVHWVFGPGGILLVYYLFGAYVYHNLEGWSYLDSCYFLTVASTTVGYGDFAPETRMGRLFSSFYLIVGITSVFRAMKPVVKVLLEMLSELVNDIGSTFSYVVFRVLKVPRVPRKLQSQLKESGILAQIGACQGPLLLVLLGVLFGLYAVGYGMIDSLYWSVCTMTTIGFGDLAPNSNWFQKLAAILYLPLAVTALTDAVGEAPGGYVVRPRGQSKVRIEATSRYLSRDLTPSSCAPRQAHRDDARTPCSSGRADRVFTELSCRRLSLHRSTASGGSDAQA